MFIFALHYYFSQIMSLFLQLKGPSKLNCTVISCHLKGDLTDSENAIQWNPHT